VLHGKEQHLSPQPNVIAVSYLSFTSTSDSRLNTAEYESLCRLLIVS
jgi:hypothetical protein